MAIDHWKKWLPETYLNLKQQGTLEAVIEKAVSQTVIEMDQLLDAGMNYDQAWEMVRQEYLLLPPEKKEPDLERPELEELLEVRKELNDLYRKYL